MAGIWGRAKGALEAGATLASGAVAEPVAGWAGILNGGDAGAVQRTRQALTYAPKTPEGQQAVQGIGDILGKLKDAAMKTPIGSAVNGFNAVADKAGDASPVLGAAVKTAPAALAMLFGPGGTATRSAVGNVAKGTAQGIERAAVTAMDNAAAVPAMRGPMAHEKGIFAGHLSKEAPIWKLEQAKTMQALGKTDREIYQHTGWFAGSADGQWRYEIPDDQARLTGARLATKEIDGQSYEDFRIGDALDHPQLYEAYPSTKDIEASFETTNGIGAHYKPGFDWIAYQNGHRSPLLSAEQQAAISEGRRPFDEFYNQPHVQEFEEALRKVDDDDAAYEAIYKQFDGEAIDGESFKLAKQANEIEKRIKENPANGYGLQGDTSLATTLHELQHAIQEREGFARGGSADGIRRNPIEYASTDDIEYAKSLPAYQNAADKDAFIRSFVEMRLGHPDEAYRRLAGEAEARLVEARRRMTPQERAASYPPDMYDVPVSEQLVRFR